MEFFKKKDPKKYWSIASKHIPTFQKKCQDTSIKY